MKKLIEAAILTELGRQAEDHGGLLLRYDGGGEVNFVRPGNYWTDVGDLADAIMRVIALAKE